MSIRSMDVKLKEKSKVQEDLKKIDQVQWELIKNTIKDSVKDLVLDEIFKDLVSLKKDKKDFF